MTKNVLIAGGGVAALEAALALHALAGERIAVELLAPEPHFWYRPLSVAEPFGLGEAHRFELSALASAAGVTFTPGALTGVESSRRRARTSVGEIPYDALLVAVGAVPSPAVPGALTFRGPADSDKVRDLLGELDAGVVRRVAFAVPGGAVWTLPTYELALLTAAHVESRGHEGIELVLVTPEEEPLELFGASGSAAVRELLDSHAVELHTGSFPTEFEDGQLRLLPEGRIALDRVVALPRLVGPRLDGLPQTIDGFIPIDQYARVRGLEDVYAAGDVANFPVKQGGIAAQLANSAAEAIAAELGADIEPEPFRPILRGLLLTGARPRYLRRELTGVGQVETAAPEPLWWPPAKIVGRHLAPFLAGFAGTESPPEPSAPSGGVEVHLRLEDTDPALARARLTPGGDEDGTVGEAMSVEPTFVAPEETLGEVADTMRVRDTGSVLVVDSSRLIGILTSRDLLRAFAARVHPSEARVREWMTAEPVAVPASAGVAAAVALMNAHRIHQLPVVDGHRPVGMLGYRQAIHRARGSGIGLGF